MQLAHILSLSLKPLQALLTRKRGQSFMDRDDVDMLEVEMERLARSAKRIVWLNPLLRYGGFEARASGIRAIMPYVDEFRPCHSLNTLADLAEVLSGSRNQTHDPQRWLKSGDPQLKDEVRP